MSVILRLRKWHLSFRVPNHSSLENHPFSCYVYPMAITQTVEVPADRRITLEVPQEIPVGRTVLTFTPAPEFLHPCPICAQNIDPDTGNPRYNAETVAGMREVDDMIAGKIPNTLRSFGSLDEMMADLDSDEPQAGNKTRQGHE